MRHHVIPIMVLALGLSAIPASADIVPIGTISSAADGALFDYTITLTNSAASTDVIGTFWYAWVPGEDFLPTAPIDGDFVTPAGWHLTVTHFPNVPTNGFALQWVADSAATALAPGDSLTFGFTSADTPAQVFGLSPFFPDTPVNTAFVYHAAPFSDPGVQFLVSAVPEPGSISLLGLGGLGIVAACCRRRAKPEAGRA